VPTQCMDSRKVLNPRNNAFVYQSNVALKVNAKLTGANTAIHPAMPNVDSLTMVMGADVHHPPPGGDRAKPSIASVVASYDANLSKYHTEISQQPNRLEPILNMKKSTLSLLRAFFSKRNQLPRHIIMYRDGVGEGMFPFMLSHELRSIKEACAEMQKGYDPKVTFIIVQKRNHVRLFPEDERMADKNGNMLAGTVVDTGIVDPHDFDFLMCSHAGLKGTSKATHYWVLADEANLSTDALQALTFNLCHIYARCSRSVSMPAPAFYAHLAAYRARLWPAEYEDDDTASVASRGSAGAAAGGAVYTIPTLRRELFDSLYFA